MQPLSSEDIKSDDATEVAAGIFTAISYFYFETTMECPQQLTLEVLAHAYRPHLTHFFPSRDVSSTTNQSSLKKKK